MDSAVSQWLLDHSALYRTRDLLQYRFFNGQPRQLAGKLREALNVELGGKPAGGDADDDMILLMKAKMRFERHQLPPQQSPVPGHRATAGQDSRLRPRSLLFYAKEDPSRVDNLLEPARYRALMGEFTALIRPFIGGKLAYLPPQAALQPRYYLDHSHLTYAGYQVLVEQLWKELGNGSLDTAP